MNYNITITEHTLIISREIEKDNVAKITYEKDMIEKPLEEIIKDFEDTILYLH